VVVRKKFDEVTGGRQGVHCLGLFSAEDSALSSLVTVPNPNPVEHGEGQDAGGENQQIKLFVFLHDRFGKESGLDFASS